MVGFELMVISTNTLSRNGIPLSPELSPLKLLSKNLLISADLKLQQNPSTQSNLDVYVTFDSSDMN